MVLQEVKAQSLQEGSDDDSGTENIRKGDAIEQSYQKPDWKAVDINFLSSYYVQDGNFSPVTGGIGTEYLTDFTQKIAVSVPLNHKLKLKVDGGYDYYSSASTDNIDNIRSSDSSSDMRTHGNVGLDFKLSGQEDFGFRIGASTEYDYTSLAAGLSYHWMSKDVNTSIGLSAQAFMDDWRIFYPVELRRQGRLVPTDKRQSYNAGLTISRIVNKKMQVSFQLEGIMMRGLLSTPFHRVYFQEQTLPKVERLPDSRFKVPIGIRINNYWADWLISRLYYRYYQDDWGINAHTMSAELPIKINRFVSIYPSYRYHRQSGSSYFLPYKQHSIENDFYSSDYDLSELDSHSVGLGATISPSGGITRFKIPFINSQFHIDGIEIKYAHYMRSTGLKADIISLGLKFVIR